MKHRLQLGVVVVAALLGIACPPTDYNPQVRDAFVKGCMTEPFATDKDCSCLYEQVKLNLPFEDFMVESLSLEAGNPPSPRYQELSVNAAAACGLR
jgi:hypothetical protein